MRRLAPWLVLASSLAVLAPRAAKADGGAPAAAPSPKLATDAEAAAALEKFKEEFKAKGLKGEEKTSQRDFALAGVSRVAHKSVVEEMGVVASGGDATLRMLAVAYLGDLRALPGAAGNKIAVALRRAPKDDVLAMTGYQSISRLGYLGAREEIKAGFKSQSFAVKKAALNAAAATADARLIEDVLQIIDVHLGQNPTASNGGKEETTEGYSWDGAEASVDTGTPGDSDQKAAEAAVAAQVAANKASATGGGGGGDGSGMVGKGGGGRSKQELVPSVMAVLKRVTGRSFTGTKEFMTWYAEHKGEIADKAKALDEAEKAQKAGAAPEPAPTPAPAK